MMARIAEASARAGRTAATALCAFLLFAGPARAQQQPPTHELLRAPARTTIAFVDVAVIPMDRERVLEHQTVVVSDGRITSIAPAASAQIPANATRVDGRGKYLIPGLVDGHAHFQPGPGNTLTDPAGQTTVQFLGYGITTVRSVAGAVSALPLRDRIARGEVLGPDLVIYSPSLNNNTIATPANAVHLVEAYKKSGYDGLKIHGGFDAETYDSLVVAAKRAKLPLIGHITPGYGLERAINAGQQIEHLDGFLQYLLPSSYSGPPVLQLTADPAVLAMMDTSRVAPLAKLVVQKGVWNGPTLALFKSIVSDSTPEQLLARSNMKYVAPNARNQWAAQRRNDPLAKASAEGRNAFVALRDQIVRALHAAGAKLLVGSDSPQAFMTVGDAVHREMAAFVEAGLSPYVALEAATRNPAEFMGKADQVGTVAVGKRANLVLLDGNPLADIANTRKVNGVLVGGRWLDRARLDAMLAALAAQFGG